MASLRQPLVLLDHLAKPLAVLLQVLADLLGRRAVAGLDHERRQDVGAQGVVHHVAFHVVAQRIDAQLVLRQRLAQPQLPPEADPAEQHHSHDADGARSEDSLPNVHPWAPFRAEISLRIVNPRQGGIARTKSYSGTERESPAILRKLPAARSVRPSTGTLRRHSRLAPWGP